MLRVLVALSRNPDRIFVTADANQSIYGSGFRWSEVHSDLRFKGRTGLLRKNYRSTREIGEATQTYLQTGALEDEPVDRVYVHAGGPLPVVRNVASRDEEPDLLARFFRAASREARLGWARAPRSFLPRQLAGLSRRDSRTMVLMPRSCRAASWNWSARQ